ncbi:ERAD-associated protein [Lecanora helva]
MTDNQAPIKAGYYAYPLAKEGPKTTYSQTPASNPVLRGIPLAVAGSAVANIGYLSNFLWSNAGFSSLRKLKLDEYDPRYDPAVIPVNKGENTLSDSSASQISYKASPPHPNRHYSIDDYHTAFKNGKLTPLSIAEVLLDLSSSPAHKNAFLSVKKDQALLAAKASTERYKNGRARGPLDGVPIAVKDEVDLKGHNKTFGSSRDFTSAKDITSWCVRKWEDAGAIILGKLNMHELGLDTSNNNPITGTPLNPHNPHYYTGGSSGGSAYAVSAGLFPVTLGADGGGSIRIPSSFCGIYGLKPSHGRVSSSPTTGLASSCGVLGPMASNMADLEYAYRLMAAPDPYDTISSMFVPPIQAPASHDRKKIIGIYKPYFEVAEPAVLDACNEAIRHFQSSGYTVIDVTLPYLPEGQLAHAITILGEISTDITDFTGLSSANKILLSIGKRTPVADFFLAQKMRHLLMQHLSFLFQKHPGLQIVTPTAPNAGWHISGGAADLKNGVSDANMSLRTMTYVWMANFTGCPSLTVPVGRVSAVEGEGKVPVGLMAMAEWGGEEQLLAWGRVAEEWAWREHDERMAKPESWVDVMAAVKND